METFTQLYVRALSTAMTTAVSMLLTVILSLNTADNTPDDLISFIEVPICLVPAYAINAN